MIKARDKFMWNGREWTLVVTETFNIDFESKKSSGKVMLLNRDFEGLSNAVAVKEIQNISSEEFEEICGGAAIGESNRVEDLLLDSQSLKQTADFSSNKEIFSQLWDKLVPQSGEPDTTPGILVWSIGRLKHEWRNNGNLNWNNAEFYLEMVENLWEILLSDNSYDEENDEEDNENSPINTEVFDESFKSQIKQDLRFIGILGMRSVLNLTEDQTEHFLKFVSSEEVINDAKCNDVFDRIESAVVMWCKANPENITHILNS